MPLWHFSHAPCARRVPACEISGDSHLEASQPHNSCRALIACLAHVGPEPAHWLSHINRLSIPLSLNQKALKQLEQEAGRGTRGKRLGGGGRAEEKVAAALARRRNDGGEVRGGAAVACQWFKLIAT